jgi:hypothetical protein
LAAFVVERIAIAVAGRISEDRHASIIFDPPHLNVIRDIAPHKVSAYAIPCRPFCPECSKVLAPDDGVVHDVSPEPIVERNDVRIRILNRILTREVTLARS